VTRKEIRLALLRASIVLRITRLLVQLVILDLPQDSSFPARLAEKRKKLEELLPRFFEEVLN
jgi:hypothetical protein